MGTNTGIGIGIGIPFKNNALGGDRPYLPPELKARLIGVWDNYGKKNTDADRNIIKNKIPNAGGDLEILNAAYKLNSGFGEYREDFTSWIVSKEPMTVKKTDSQVHISYIGTSYKKLPMFEYSGPINENYSLTVEIQDIPNNVIGKFIHNNGFTQEVTNGINTIKFSNSGSWYGFTFYREDNTIIGDCDITIKQIPSFEGALVTDGINDIIASIKTLEEWNIGDKGITIVSMIHQINTNTNNFITTNNIRTDNKVIGRNLVSNIEKTGIYGWYKENIQSDTINVINNILGDENDYISHSSSSTNINPINNSKFYVQGYAVENGFNELSSVAHYWTFAVLGKATEDEINLIIAKYNLDRTLKPDILCNIERQGITNDNHADFNDKLIDYSGNGRDIQMYNLAWKGGSGVVAKKFETIKDYLIVPDEGLQELTIYNEFSYKVKSIKYADRYWTVQSLNKTYVSYPITIIADKDIIWRNTLNYTDENGVKGSIRKETNVPANTPTQVFVLGFNDFDVPDNYTKVNCVAYATRTDITEFTVIFIPSCKGGILLDGIEDFGKVTGMPIYKDYTFIIERQIITNDDSGGIVASKSESATDVTKQGAFIFEYLSSNSISTWSYYKNNSLVASSNSNRNISYQSKYSYNGKGIEIGEAKDSDKLWIGTIRDNDERFANIAIYSLMSFPYSMSEFLIERQLKKHKLGTLYPDMVEFRPVIKANNDYEIVYTAIIKPNNWQEISVGDYVTVGESVAIQLKLNNSLEITNISSTSLADVNFYKEDNSDNVYTIYGRLLDGKSPQKINITIDEYIRFEDIVQPYPMFFEFTDENNNLISWGGKAKVGSTITRTKSVANANLLAGMYNTSSYKLNGKPLEGNSYVVEKSMVFTCTATWAFDNNEPKCILSPRLLRIPNSSYKILGHIPDISGHGNHGKINNSAYAEMSGANGYPIILGAGKSYQDMGSYSKIVGDNQNIINITSIVFTTALLFSYVKNKGSLVNTWNKDYPSYKIKVTGIEESFNLQYTYLESSDAAITSKIYIENDGIYTIPKSYKSNGSLTNDNAWIGFSFNGSASEQVNLTIEILPEYEGAYCLDGVNDFVTIPTLSSGGKQVLMKVNWQNDYDVPGYMYDSNIREYRNYIIKGNKEQVAYENASKTYIDGIQNSNITSGDLKDITHNITSQFNGASDTPYIGCRYSLENFLKMALYDFMLFDNISTDDKIKELNEYVGIEAKVELPPYYWDAYGKTNLDEYKAIIQQRGIAVGDYDITNYNHAYDKMSGYGGYAFAKFDNTSEWNLIRNSTGIEVVSRNGYSCTLKRVGSNVWDFGNSSNRKIGKDLNVNIKCDKNIKIKWQLKYKTTENPDTEITVELVNDSIGPNPKSITLPHKTDEELTTLGAIESSVYYLVYFDSSTLPIGEEYTVEMLPLYPNGLVYDGVTDYSENTNIPAFTDYTYIFKREFKNLANSATIAKSPDKLHGGAFVADYNGTSQFSFGQQNDNLPIQGISWQTKNSFNGTSINSGTNTDDKGITIGRFSTGYANIVFQKLILYPKTIPLLQINFLKNLMERDEIIDLDNPIFKK